MALREAIFAGMVAAIPVCVWAEPFIDNPGFCEADGAEQELADVAFLSETGIESHAVGCTWLLAPQRFGPGRKAKLKARCDDGAKTWVTEFDLQVNRQGRVIVWGATAAGLPEFYFDCAKWGRKRR